MANGRRQKCAISRLVSEQGNISDPRGLQEHIYSFYRELLGEPGEPRSFALSPDMWAMVGRVTDEENEELMLTFSEKDLDEVLASMKVDTAPGPDGLPVIFYKSFWALAQPYILAILNDIVLGRMDISWLNYGVLTLIPKI